MSRTSRFCNQLSKTTHSWK